MHIETRRRGCNTKDATVEPTIFSGEDLFRVTCDKNDARHTSDIAAPGSHVAPKRKTADDERPARPWRPVCCSASLVARSVVGETRRTAGGGRAEPVPKKNSWSVSVGPQARMDVLPKEYPRPRAVERNVGM